MATAATIPVRLSKEILERLDSYAKRLGIKRSEAIRLCLAYQLGVIETADPRELPNLDGRKWRYEPAIEALPQTGIATLSPTARAAAGKKLPLASTGKKEAAVNARKRVG